MVFIERKIALVGRNTEKTREKNCFTISDYFFLYADLPSGLWIHYEWNIFWTVVENLSSLFLEKVKLRKLDTWKQSAEWMLFMGKV